jgi:hypothetical protein
MPRLTHDGRNHRIVVRLGDDEYSQLQAVARRAGLSTSDYLRQKVRSDFREAFPRRQPAKATP